MQVIGYVRVSTDEQSLSVEAQHQALEHWCQAHQAQLVNVYADVGVSGVRYWRNAQGSWMRSMP
jgi:DNA invertase Pin-like site-specific DNA recombinase